MSVSRFVLPALALTLIGAAGWAQAQVASPQTPPPTSAPAMPPAHQATPPPMNAPYPPSSATRMPPPRPLDSQQRGEPHHPKMPKDGPMKAPPPPSSRDGMPMTPPPVDNPPDPAHSEIKPR